LAIRGGAERLVFTAEFETGREVGQLIHAGASTCRRKEREGGEREGRNEKQNKKKEEEDEDEEKAKGGKTEEEEETNRAWSIRGSRTAKKRHENIENKKEHKQQQKQNYIDVGLVVLRAARPVSIHIGHDRVQEAQIKRRAIAVLTPIGPEEERGGKVMRRRKRS
jgi:hypothetical protein